MTGPLLYALLLHTQCIHTVMPTKSETTDTIPIIQHNDKIVGYLRASTFLERPDNMRKCG